VNAAVYIFHIYIRTLLHGLVVNFPSFCVLFLDVLPSSVRWASLLFLVAVATSFCSSHWACSFHKSWRSHSHKQITNHWVESLQWLRLFDKPPQALQLVSTIFTLVNEQQVN